MIGDSVAHLKGGMAGASCSMPSTTSTATRRTRDYALACVRAAMRGRCRLRRPLRDATAARCRIEVEQIVAAAAAALPEPAAVGIHCHNDSGCAVANTLAAVRAGATQVQGTVNGFGERVGNTDLLTVVADLELKMGCTNAWGERQPAST